MVVLPSPVCSGDGAECCTADELAALVELDEVVLGWLLTLGVLLYFGATLRRGLADRRDRPDDRGGHESVSDSHHLDTEHREGLQVSARFLSAAPRVPPVTPRVPEDLGDPAPGSAADT